MVTVALTALPLKVTRDGDKEHVVLAGIPLQESETVPLKPKTGWTVSVVAPECPREIVSEAGESETEKSSTFCASAAEEIPWKFALLDENTAVTVWLPPVRALVENCAVPLESVEVCVGVELPSR